MYLKRRKSRTFVLAMVFLAVVAANAGVYQSDMQGVAAQYYRTGGLGFNIQDNAGKPTVMLPVGVMQGNPFTGPYLCPFPSLLGTVSTVAGSFQSQSANSVSNTLRFGNGGASDLYVTLARLSPAMLLESGADTISLFAPDGATTLDEIEATEKNFGHTAPSQWWNNINPIEGGLIKPLRWATRNSGGTIVTGVLGTQTLQNFPVSNITRATSQAGSPSNPPLADLDTEWLLLWYGADSSFVSNEVPFAYMMSYYLVVPPHTPIWPKSESCHQADIPILIVPEKVPTAISYDSATGISLTFSGGVGKMAAIPLYGHLMPRAADTEQWLAGLPTEVVARCDAWAARVAEYPTNVTETASYDSGQDRVTITEDFDWVTVRAGGQKEAPLPAMLALAQHQGLNVSFSGSLNDTDTATVFGHVATINGDSYTWSIDGLGSYLPEQTDMGPSNSKSTPIEAMLEAQIDKILAAGHLAPYIYANRNVWGGGGMGSVYWYDPSETLYFLAECLPLLPPAKQASLITYMTNERTSYPPETVLALSTTSGTPRTAWDTSWFAGGYTPPAARSGSAEFAEGGAYGTSLWRAYGLSRYYQATGGNPPAGVLSFCQTAFNNSVQYRQWDTMGWFWGKYTFDRGDHSYQYSTRCVNRDLAGTLGYLRLCSLAGQAGPNEVWGQYAKLAALRYAMTKYACYQANMGMVQLPTNTTAANALKRWDNFTNPDNYVFQVQDLSQYGVSLTMGYTGTAAFGAHMVTFLDMVPETGRLLADWGLGRTVAHYLDRFAQRQPDWFCTEAGSIYGNEWRYMYPGDSHQLFMAHAWTANTVPDRLARYIDVPWMEKGDLYYIQKLAETVKAYRNKQVLAATGQATMYKDNVNVTAMVNEAVQEARNSFGTGTPKIVLVSESIDATGDTVLNAIKTEFGNNVLICGVHINSNNYRPMTIETFPLLDYKSIAIMALGNEIDVQTGKADGYDAADIAAQRATGVALGAQFTPDPQRKNLLLVMGAQHAAGVVNTVQGLRDSLSAGGPFPDYLKGFGWGTLEHNDHVYYNSVRYFNTNPNASVVGVMITGDFEWAFSGQAQTGDPPGAGAFTGWANALAESTVHVNNIVDELGGVPDVTFYAPAHPNEVTFEPMRAAAESILGSGAALFGWHAASETGHDTTNSDILGTTYHFFVAGIRGDVEVDPDVTPPTPDPMTWATVPHATGETSVSMTATTAADDSGVEYYFECTAGGGHSSGWLSNPTYNDVGLAPSTQYTYRVKARDKSGNQNETGWSGAGSATTLTPDTTPPDPNTLTWASAPAASGSNSVIMTATTATDPSGVEYYFECTAGGGNSSNWQDSPNYEDTGLTPDTEYTYRAKARDKSSYHNETGWTSEASATTDPPDLTPPSPDPLTWADAPQGASESSISMTASTATDSSGVEYYFECAAGDGNSSAWQSSPTYVDTGLTPDTQYTYRAKARDKSANHNETGWTNEVQTSTYPPDLAPPNPDTLTWASEPNAMGQTSIAMTATTAADPSGVEYYFECTAGSGNSSDWQTSAGYQDTGLDPDTEYTYRVKARDKSLNQNETGWSSELSATTEAPPGPEVVGWWKFDETSSGPVAFDSSGNGNDGTFVDNPTPTSPGRVGGALSFDGIDDNIDVLGENRIVNLPTGDFTVTWWMNWNQNTSENSDTIMGKYGNNGVAPAGWQIYVKQNERQLNFQAQYETTDFWFRSGVDEIPANTWTHIAVVFEAATTTAKFYVDGVETTYSKEQTGVGGYITDASVRTQFGRAYWSGNYYRGLLDDIRFHNWALSQAEIVDVMNYTGAPSADIDGNGTVDYVDLGMLADQWLWTGASGGIVEDIISDGSVDFVDYAQLADEWTGIPSADIDNSGTVDYMDLGMLADQWLWTGAAGGIDEDIVSDGSVDFIDYAELADQWISGN